MSRSWVFLFAIGMIAPLPALAQNTQSSEDRKIAEKMLGASGRITPDRIRNQCANPTRQGEIVVCAPKKDEFRIPSTADSEADSDQALNDGRLHTPDVGGNGIFKGKATKSNVCMIPPCPPEQPYLIDLSSIPEAPVGSDADKIAKGELRAP